MANNVLDQLADAEIPEAPADFGDQFHDRLNGRMLLLQMLDLAVFALPYALFHFGRGLVGAVMFSLADKHGKGPERENEKA